MSECFGVDWMINLPQCCTPEYMYLSKIIDVIKVAFKQELSSANAVLKPLPGEE
jgi:hypothetical protein